MDAIERAPLRLKLALLVALPLIAAAWAMSLQIKSAVEMRTRLDGVVRTTELATLAQGAVRELQRERGLSAFLALDPGQTADGSLREQYRATDAQLALLEAYLDGLEPEARLEADEALGGLASFSTTLEALRSEPPTFTRIGEFDAYSALIQRANDITDTLSGGTDLDTAREAQAFVTLVRLTEATAQERGLVGLLASSGLSNELQRDAQVRMGVATSLQGALSRQLVADDPSLSDAWLAIERSPASVRARAMRQQALAPAPGPGPGPGPGPVGVSAIEWFDALSAKLDRMYALESSVASDLMSSADAASAAQRSQTWSISLGTAALLLASAGGAYVVARSVSGPVERLARTAARLADGDVSGDPRVVSTDALGELATSFDSMIARQRELTRTANEIAADRLDVEVSVRSEHDELGRAIGVMLRRLRDSRAELERVADEASALAAREAAASRSARRVAREDGLTSLINRSTFIHEVERAIREATIRGEECRLLFIDLDRFKDINDSSGHSTGDEVLRQVAARLRVYLDERDIVGRVGGDEFTVLLRPDATQEDAERIASELVEALCEPYVVGQATHHLGASIGLTTSPQDATEPEALLRCADAAMYEAKRTGGNTRVVFNSHLEARLSAGAGLEQRLRDAMENDALEVHYQPIVNIVSGEAVGAEALLRFAGESSSIAEVIQVAERTGLIEPLGEWILERALRDAKDLGGDGQPLDIGINVSPVQLRRPDFVECLEGALVRTGFPPERVVIELTESALIDDMQNALEKLHAIRALGVRIGVDDFGTGHASLEYLLSLPVDVVKIDRRFIANLVSDRRSAAIVRAAGLLARELGFSLIAEGVESIDQARALLSFGYEHAQGFLLGRPVPLEQWQAGEANLAPRVLAKSEDERAA